MSSAKSATENALAFAASNEIPLDEIAVLEDTGSPGLTKDVTGLHVVTSSFLKDDQITNKNAVSNDLSDEDESGNEGASLNSMNKLSLDDESGVDIQSSNVGRYRTHYSAKGKSKSYSPGHRYGSGSGFVRHSSDNRDVDPFAISPSRQGQQCGNSNYRSVNATPTKRFHLNWRSSGSGSGSGSSGTDESPTPAHRQSQNVGAICNRGITQTISGRNAQAFYPPKACVFVANLLQTEDEIQLEYGVTKVFSEFGPVFVKIRRDGKNMPFAFCQFTTEEDAIRAIKEGRGRIIHGRPCRTEKAKANRVYYMTRKDGRAISEAQALPIIQQFGLVKDHWTVDNRTQVMAGLQGLQPGLFIEFEFYENGRDAQNVFFTSLRDPESDYELSTPHMDGSPQRQTNAKGLPRNAHCRNYLDEYAVDRDSVFVGNLPDDMTAEKITEFFSSCGQVVDIKLHHQVSKRAGCDVNVFAFVQFSDPLAVRRAIHTKNDSFVGGQTIRVRQKDSNHSNSIKSRRSIEQEHAQISHHEHEHVQTSYRSPTSFGSIDNSPTVQGEPNALTSFPPTPVSGGYSPNFVQPGYSPPGWGMSPIQIGGYSPIQYPYAYYTHPQYGFQYPYQYPIDYSGQSHHSMHMSYGYSAPIAQPGMEISQEDSSIPPIGDSTITALEPTSEIEQ